MAVANTLAYYVTVTIMAVKSFIAQAPGAKQHLFDKIECKSSFEI
jgi:hypothetical protein